MKYFPATVGHFLSENYLATLATITPQSDYPYLRPLFYIADKSKLYFASHKLSKKLANIKSHPRVTVSITNAENLTSLQLQGSAQISEQNSDLIQKLLQTANDHIQNSLPPLMQIGEGVMTLITVHVHRFQWSNFSGKHARFQEGTIEQHLP